MLLVETAVAEKWETLYGHDLRYSGTPIAWMSIGERSSGDVEDGEGGSGSATA